MDLVEKRREIYQHYAATAAPPKLARDDLVALGLPAALRSDGVVEGRCPDCDQPIAIRIREGALDPIEAVVHFLVPAANWYENLSFS